MPRLYQISCSLIGRFPKHVSRFHVLTIRGLLLIVVVLFTFTCETAAQKITVSDPLSIRNDLGYEIIGRFRDRILLFRDRYDNYEVQAFDLQMRASWNHELEDLDKRGTKVIGVVAGKNDFSIIYSERKRGRFYLKIHKYDPGARMIDSLTIKVYSERIFSPPELDLIKSEDRNCIAVFNVAEKDQLEVTCFRIDQMKLLWDKTAIFESEFIDRNLRGMALSNTGAFFSISEYDNRKGKIESHRLQILRMSDGGDLIRQVPLPEVLTTDMKVIYDNVNKRLAGAGLWGEKNKERANGTFYFNTNFDSDTAVVLKKTAFDDQLISILRRKEVADDTRGIADADVSHLILREDGGLALIVERHYEVQRGTASSSRIMRDSRLIIDYYYDDVFLLGLSTDGTQQWQTVLHKKQYSQDDEGVFSSFFLFRQIDQLRFLFNDEIRYENTCSEYTISALGAFDRNSLINTEKQGLRLRFRDGLQISANECIIPSEYRGKLRLVTVKY